MRIVRRPRQHTLLACLILLSSPISLLNIWVMQKGVLSKVLQRDKLWWIGIEAVWAFVTLLWLLGARWRGFWSFMALSATLLGGNLYFLLTMKNYALAFYALFLLILSALYGMHVFKSLSEAYYNSGRRWYEGLPRFLPRVEAEILSLGKAIPVRLSRLGTDGCYAFASAGESLGLPERIALKLGDLRLDCAVELVSRSDRPEGRSEGCGLRFVAASADQHKDIWEFIDRVRSAGYVS